MLALIAYAIHEHQAGDAKRIRVELSPRGCTLEDDGRGMGLDRAGYVSSLVEQLTERQTLTALHGIGIAIVAMSSPWLMVESHRNNSLHKQVFSWGRALGPVESGPGSREFGTRVTLMLPQEATPIDPGPVFEQVEHWRASFPELLIDVTVRS